LVVGAGIPDALPPLAASLLALATAALVVEDKDFLLEYTPPSPPPPFEASMASFLPLALYNWETRTAPPAEEVHV